MTLGLETVSKLQAFVEGKLSPEELEEWVVSVEDEEFPLDERPLLDNLRLILVEYGEELRPLSEVQAAVLGAFVSATGNMDIRGDSTTTTEERNFIEVPDSVAATL